MLHLNYLTAEEQFRTTGTISPNKIASLLDTCHAAEKLDGALGYVNEAMASYPAEDFMADLKTKLEALRSNLRGKNRESMDAIMATVEDLEMTTFYAADYGRGELKKVAQALN